MKDKTLYDKDSIQSLSPLEHIYGYIYCIENFINHKKYIGSTRNSLTKRFNQHKTKAFTKNEKSNYPLYNAFRKYGVDNFTIYSIFEGVFDTDESLRKLEQKYIIDYNTLLPEGYNQTIYTKQPSKGKETREKISKTKRKRARNVVEYSPDNLEIVQEWNSIRDCAEDLSLNEIHIADCCNGRRHTTGNKYFCWLTSTGDLDIPVYIGSNSYKGAYGGETRPVSTSRIIQQIDNQTKEILDEYPTAALAARKTNSDSSCIIAVCRHKRKTHNGYVWRYKDESS